MRASAAAVLAVVLVQTPGAARGPSLGAPAGTDAPGPAIGAMVPAFEAPDQDGRRRSFESLRGTNGLLLVFSRSADW